MNVRLRLRPAAHPTPSRPPNGTAILPEPHRAASTTWRTHQADRAWIEWGLCLPPISIRRPRCLVCTATWPCDPALAAHAALTSPGRAPGQTPPASEQSR